MLELTYQDGDKLLVPVDKLHMVQKYAGADGKAPALDKLGGKRWQSRKKKSLEAVRKMAGELLALYARRAAAEGQAYGPDTVWLKEFEASFIYEETPDQIEAIEQVKADMMNPSRWTGSVRRRRLRRRGGDPRGVQGLTRSAGGAAAPTTSLLVAAAFQHVRRAFADYPSASRRCRGSRASSSRSHAGAACDGDVDLVIVTHRSCRAT